MQFDDSAARNRFESFRLGKGLPPALKHTHARSHSRNASLSLSLNDLSLPSSLPPSPSPTATTTPNPNPMPPSKRNSHHRRRSSVSTRHESAEIMGVALPDLPPSTSDDNINLGEKDSIRRRALWALEGKPDISFNKVQIPDISIPDIEKMVFDFSTKPSSTYSNLNSLAASGKRDSFKLLGSSSSSKDQLGTLLEEEEEEEEEGEQEISTTVLPSSATSAVPPPPNTPISPITPVTPALSITKATPSKPRPTNLNLRPLSLTPDNLPGIIQVASLPSPSPTPSPRQGLRSLSLTPNNADDDSASSAAPVSFQQSRRSSLTISPTPSSRRPILNLALEQLESTATAPSAPGDVNQKPQRRSSISYKRSHTTINSTGLPTPEMTPTFSRHTSSSLSTGSVNDSDEVFPNPPTPQSRPLSASEQHFLFKSHNALLARITDLERALSMRRRESGGYSNGGSSRPASVASNFSSTSSGVGGSGSEPSDEMLNLITDLKAERDELKRDVDGWRTRVTDMENQMGVLSKRVENERREAWVARSRVGLLEVEKEVLKKKMEELDEMFAAHEEEKNEWESEIKVLLRENEEKSKRIKDLEEELTLVRRELEEERRKKVGENIVDPLLTPTPTSFDSFKRPGMGLPLNKKHGLGFASLDSESSTDVEQDSSDDTHAAFGFSLKAVQEEPDEVEDYSEEEDNGLLGYEDEEDTDMSLQSSSSLSSDEEDMPRSLAHLHQDVPTSPSTPKFQQVFTPPKSSNHGHARRATLSKTWTFPFGAGHAVTPPKAQADEEETDRFFGCLDEGDNDPMGSVPNSPSAYSYEKSKGLFSSGFKFADADDNASFFVIPDGVGTLVSSDEEDKDQKHLSVVTEEEEDDEEEQDGKHQVEVDDVEDDNMFGEIGGIRITFTPPQEDVVVEEKKQIQLVSPIKRTSPPPVLPALDFGDDDEEDDGESDAESLSRGIPFNFGRPLLPLEEREPSPPPVPVVVTPVITHSRPSSPSMIPRPASPSSSSSKSRPVAPVLTPKSVSTSPVSPVRVAAVTASSPSPSSFITPPNKRGGTSPSFIPQPISSPSPMRSAPVLAKTRGSAIPTSTFIPQPPRKPLLPSGVPTLSSLSSAKVQAHSNVTSVNAAMNTRRFRRSSDDPYVAPAPAQLPPAIFFDGNHDQQRSSAAQMKSIDLSHDSAVSFWSPSSPNSIPSPSTSASSTRQSNTSVSSNASSSISSIVSFQAITNFLPLSWGSRPSVPFISVTQHTPVGSIDDDPTVVAPLPSSTSSPRPPKTGQFVSRQQQLKKLKARMEVEGQLAMQMQAQVQCRKCDGAVVHI